MGRYCRAGRIGRFSPEYLANGWRIGSGAVESACETVVGQRLKSSGMRWGQDGPMPRATSAPSTAASEASEMPFRRRLISPH